MIFTWQDFATCAQANDDETRWRKQHEVLPALNHNEIWAQIKNVKTAGDIAAILGGPQTYRFLPSEGMYRVVDNVLAHTPTLRNAEAETYRTWIGEEYDWMMA